MKQITFTRDNFTEKRQGFTYNDLCEDAQEKVIREHTEFLVEMAEDNTEGGFDKEYVITHLEINDYLFDEDGELLPITTHTGKDNEVLKHTWGKNEYPCEIFELPTIN